MGPGSQGGPHFCQMRLRPIYGGSKGCLISSCVLDYQKEVQTGPFRASAVPSLILGLSLSHYLANILQGKVFRHRVEVPRCVQQEKATECDRTALDSGVEHVERWVGSQDHRIKTLWSRTGPGEEGPQWKLTAAQRGERVKGSHPLRWVLTEGRGVWRKGRYRVS